MMQNRQWYALMNSGRLKGISRWNITELNPEARDANASTEFAFVMRARAPRIADRAHTADD